MLTGTRNMIAMVFLSGFLFTKWNDCTEILTPSSARIESDVFKYGLIYYSTGAPETWIENANPFVYGSIRYQSEKKFIVKTRRTGNKFYHHFYKNHLLEPAAENLVSLSAPVNLIFSGTITFPFAP